jgi:hypothetical protein
VFGEQVKPGEIWNIVHYVQSLRVAAHVDELTSEGLDSGQVAVARRQLWDDLSPAASRGDIEARVTEEGAAVAAAPAAGTGDAG